MFKDEPEVGPKPDEVGNKELLRWLQVHHADRQRWVVR